MTPDDEDGLTGAFDEILDSLEHVLAVEQTAQLRTVIDYDEHELAFEMLSAVLRDAGATVPDSARELFLHLAHQLRIDITLWRDVCDPSTH